MKIQELLSQASHITHRPVNSYREASLPGPAPHDTQPMAPEKSLEDPGITRKGDLNDSIPRSLDPHLT